MDGLKPGRIVYFVANTDVGTWVEASIRLGRYQNHVREGDILPAMVVAVFGEHTCNLKVFLDGPDNYWATSVQYDEGKAPRSWHWMFEGQQTRYKPDRVETTT